jgi:alpha-galactosidase/6-phospho-beta-glucosidase family protein
MSFNVPDEVKIAMLTERIKALNIEGYQHELNKKAAEAIGNDEVVASSEQAIEIIANAIAVHEQELAELA